MHAQLFLVEIKREFFFLFQVKTTSPKKYCVRPNIGVIKPKSTYDFTGIYNFPYWF